MEAVPGYLSLHQNADIMTLKWTPNQLMNGSVGDFDYERRCGIFSLNRFWGLLCVFQRQQQLPGSIFYHNEQRH